MRETKKKLVEREQVTVRGGRGELEGEMVGGVVRESYYSDEHYETFQSRLDPF